MGYSWRPVTSGSNGFSLGLSVRQYCNVRAAACTPHLQLAEGGQKAGAVGLDVATLPTEAKLDSEPVAGGQALHILV